MAIVSFDQFAKGKPLTPQQMGSGTPPVAPRKPGFLESLGDAWDEREANVQRVKASDQNILSKGFQTLGQSAGFLGDVVGESISAITPDAIGEVAMDAVGAVANTAPVKSAVESYQEWKAAHPEAAGNLEATINIGSIIPAAKGVQMGGRAGLKAGEAVVDTAAEVAKRTGEVAKPVTDVLSIAADGVARIPGRISTNMAEKSATRATINDLPTDVARQAASNGVDVGDIRALYELPKEQLPALRELADAARDYSNGLTRVRPEEVVGKPLVQRITDLTSQQGAIGQQLGKVADTLGEVTAPELIPAVIAKLQRVPGMEGLRFVDGRSGELDFTDTVLQTVETAADRKAIQTIFADAIKPGSAKQKHLLRQELFEVLGGKKKSGIAITGTQERAYQAIRQALSDVLDRKNPQYKALNQQYAKIATPLEQLRRFLRTQPDMSDDLKNLSAGLLARRLTSNAVSNPQIRAILEALDKAGDAKGASKVSLEALQDLYNILDRYYDIAGRTGLQGQVTSGLEGAMGSGGILDRIGQAVGGFAGKTDAVKMRALEDVIEETLRATD